MLACMHVPERVIRRASQFHAPCRPFTGSRPPRYRPQLTWPPVERTRLCMDGISRLSYVCRNSLVPEAYPEGLKLEVEPNEGVKEVTYDEEEKVVRIPLSAMEGGRRTKLVMFTCNKCGGRSARLVNPLAWQKGLVFCQCQHCEVWHTLASNNPKILEEIRYNELPDEPQEDPQQNKLETVDLDLEESTGSDLSSNTNTNGVLVQDPLQDDATSRPSL